MEAIRTCSCPTASTKGLFKKYSSIENEFNEEFMTKVREEVPPETLFVVQEKVHGANTSFMCSFQEDGSLAIAFAKRTAPVEEDEKFYDYQRLIPLCEESLGKIGSILRERYPSVASFNVFGELFGGSYPHPDVKADRSFSAVQKGVFYHPAHGFYAFDIYIVDEGVGRFLGVDEANGIFEQVGMLYARTLFEGTLEECLKYPNAFPSKISAWLGLPEIEDNICEGVVIRPKMPLYLRKGDRILIKSKNARFAEKKGAKGPRPEKTKEMSEELSAQIAVVEDYITPARLDSVISKIREVYFPKDMPKVGGLYAKDVIEDYLKEHEGDYLELERTDQKAFNRYVSSRSFTLIRSLKLQRNETRM